MEDPEADERVQVEGIAIFTPPLPSVTGDPSDGQPISPPGNGDNPAPRRSTTFSDLVDAFGTSFATLKTLRPSLGPVDGQLHEPWMLTGAVKTINHDLGLLDGRNMGYHATTRAALATVGLTTGRWRWGEIEQADQRPEGEEEDAAQRAARKEAQELLRAVPMCVKAWRCQRLGRNHTWTEALATLDVTSKVLLLRNLQVSGGRADPVCLARDCVVDFLGERSVVVAKQPRPHWAVRVSAPLRRCYVIALEPKDMAVACFRLLRAASLHLIPRPPVPKPLKRKVPSPPPPPAPRPPTVCVHWDGRYVGIVPLSTMWSSVTKRWSGFEAAPEVERPKTPVMPLPNAVRFLVLLRRYRARFGRRWRLKLRASALIFGWVQRKRGHAYLQQRDLQTMTKLCDDLVEELGRRGGLLSTSLAPLKSAHAVDVPLEGQPSLQSLLSDYVHAVSVEEEQRHKEHLTSIRSRSKAKCEALLVALHTLDMARAEVEQAGLAQDETSSAVAEEAAAASASSNSSADANPQEEGSLVAVKEPSSRLPDESHSTQTVMRQDEGMREEEARRSQQEQREAKRAESENEEGTGTRARLNAIAGTGVQGAAGGSVTVEAHDLRQQQHSAAVAPAQDSERPQGELCPSVEDLADEVHRQLWSLFWEFNAIRQQRGWRVPWALLVRVANVITMHLWHKAMAAMDKGDRALAQSLLALRLELQQEELQLMPHVGDTDVCATKVGLARCLVLSNLSMPQALSLLHEAHCHVWALRNATAAHIKYVHRCVWRHWGARQWAHRQWRRVASRGMRLILLLGACEAYKHRRSRCLIQAVNQLALHSYWHQLQRQASQKAQQKWSLRQLQYTLRRWRLTAVLHKLHSRLHRLRFTSVWRHWYRSFRVSVLLRRVVREDMAPRVVATCLALGLKACRRAILSDISAKADAERRLRAVMLLQSRMRGLLVGMAVGRQQQEMHATYALQNDVSFVIHPPDRPPQRLTASIVTGQLRDMRRGLMLRISSKDATGAEGAEGSGVYYATVSELMEVLRGQAPRELRTPLKLQQVCERLWPTKLTLLPGPACLLEAPAPDEWLNSRVNRSINKRHKRMAQCFVHSVLEIGLLIATTAVGPIVIPRGTEPRASMTSRLSMTTRASVTRPRESRSSVASASNRKSGVNRVSLLIGPSKPAKRPSAVFLHREQREVMATHTEELQTAALLCAQALDFHHGLAQLEEDLLRSPIGSGDASHALRLSSTLLAKLEDSLDKHLDKAGQLILQEERRFVEARKAADRAYTEALLTFKDTCRLQDALRGKQRAKLGPGSQYGLYAYAEALAKRRGDAQELWLSAQRVSREVEDMKAGMRAYGSRLEDHRLALRWLANERRAAVSRLFKGAVTWRAESVTVTGQERDDVELDVFRLVCLRKLAKSRGMEPNLTKLTHRLDKAASRAETDAHLWAQHVRSCARALLSELEHAHRLVLSTMVGLRVGTRCRAMSEELRIMALHNRLSYPLYRKAMDRQARDAHARALKNIADEAKRPRIKKVSGLYEQQLNVAVHRPRLTAEDHWWAIQTAVNAVQETAVRLRALTMDFKPVKLTDDQSDVHPLLFKAYGYVTESDNVELERLKTMQNNMRDDLASLQDMLYRRDIVNAMSLYWGVVGRTYRGEALACNVAPPLVPHFHSIRDQMNAETYQRFQYIIRLSGRVPARQVIRLPTLPTEELLSKVATRSLGPPLTAQDLRRFRPLMPWSRKKLMAAALRIQRAYRTLLRRRNYRLRMLVRLQRWVRCELAVQLANAIRIQRWYRTRCEMRPLEERAKLKALAEKKLRRDMRRLHVLYVKERSADGNSYYYRNRMTGTMQWVKPAVFGDAQGPYDAPTPRTHRVIVRLCLSGPQVWYPRKLAARFGVYGGRTEVHEVEAAHTIKRLLRKAVACARAEQRGKASQDSAESASTSKDPAHYSSSVRDLIALTRTRRAKETHKKHTHDGGKGAGGAKREAAEWLKLWWRRQRARRRMWRLLAKLYKPKITLEVAPTSWPRVALTSIEPLGPVNEESQEHAGRGGEGKKIGWWGAEGTKDYGHTRSIEEAEQEQRTETGGAYAWHSSGVGQTTPSGYETQQWDGDYTARWGVDTEEVGETQEPGPSMSQEQWAALTPEQQAMAWTQYYERTAMQAHSEDMPPGVKTESDPLATGRALAGPGDTSDSASMPIEAWEALTTEQQEMLWTRYYAQAARVKREQGREVQAEGQRRSRVESTEGTEEGRTMSQQEWDALTPEQQAFVWSQYTAQTGQGTEEADEAAASWGEERG